MHIKWNQREEKNYLAFFHTSLQKVELRFTAHYAAQPRKEQFGCTIINIIRTASFSIYRVQLSTISVARVISVAARRARNPRPRWKRFAKNSRNAKIIFRGYRRSEFPPFTSRSFDEANKIIPSLLGRDCTLSFDAIDRTISRLDYAISFLAHRKVTDLKTAPLRINRVFPHAAFNIAGLPPANPERFSENFNLWKCDLCEEPTHKGHAFMSEMEEDTLAPPFSEKKRKMSKEVGVALCSWKNSRNFS